METEPLCKYCKVPMILAGCCSRDCYEKTCNPPVQDARNNMYIRAVQLLHRYADIHAATCEYAMTLKSVSKSEKHRAVLIAQEFYADLEYFGCLPSDEVMRRLQNGIEAIRRSLE